MTLATASLRAKQQFIIPHTSIPPLLSIRPSRSRILFPLRGSSSSNQNLPSFRSIRASSTSNGQSFQVCMSSLIYLLFFNQWISTISVDFCLFTFLSRIRILVLRLWGTCWTTSTNHGRNFMLQVVRGLQFLVLNCLL